MKTILNVESPKTQSVKAVCALLAWKGRPSNPLPSFVEMGEGDSRLVLVLSNKKDSYYTTTARACSCPSAVYNPGKPCKHQRAYFPEQTGIKQPNAGRWHGHNGPVLDEVRPAKAAASPLVDCLADPTSRDVAYWSIQEDKALWPMVEA